MRICGIKVILDKYLPRRQWYIIASREVYEQFREVAINEQISQKKDRIFTKEKDKK